MIEADDCQLEQAFLNILLNGLAAMETKGALTISTETSTAVAGSTAPGSSASPGFVQIAITDTGKGIAPEHISRIFEPFFTTKPVGKGTGLGLSLSYGIVDKHHGRIEVDSELGVGTTFRVILPIQPESGESTANNTEIPV